MIRIILVLLAAIPTAIHAQIINFQNTYRQNDLLTGRQVDFPHFNSDGTGLIWDISEWMDSNNNDDYTVKYDAVVGMDDRFTAVTEQDTRYTYKLDDNSLLVCGFENRIAKINYDQPECYLRFPMFYGDSIEGYFHGLGRYCDRLSLRHYGRYKTRVEGIGCIVVADGDTLKNVICLHTERIMSTQLSDITQYGNLPKYSEDSIARHLITDTTLIRTNIFRWYANGYRYPIIETRTRYDGTGENLLASAAYFYPPSAQALINNDPANEQTRGCTRGGGVTDGTLYENYQDEGVLTHQQPYRFTTSGDGKHAILEYHVPKETLVSYTLYTLDGCVLIQMPPRVQASGFYKESINLKGTNIGVYILDLCLGDEHLIHKHIFLK